MRACRRVVPSMAVRGTGSLRIAWRSTLCFQRGSTPPCGAVPTRGLGWLPNPVRRSLAAVDDLQVWPVLFGFDDRRLPLSGQILKAFRIDQRLVKLATLVGAYFG
jgi:hypothetical protein